jgi:serine/threonine-protein kinase
MLYECLSGERPTQADNLGQILKIITTRSFRPLAERVENLPNDISDLVERCLRLDKNDRPANAGEVLRVLDRYANAPDVPRLVVTPRPKDEPATALASTVRAVPSAPKLPETEEKPSQRPTWLFIPALVLAGAGIVYWQSLRAPPVQPTVTNTEPAPKTTESIAPEPKVSATATAPEPAPSETHAVLPAHSIRVPPTASASASAPSSARHVKVVTEPPF